MRAESWQAERTSMAIRTVAFVTTGEEKYKKSKKKMVTCYNSKRLNITQMSVTKKRPSKQPKNRSIKSSPEKNSRFNKIQALATTT